MLALLRYCFGSGLAPSTCSWMRSIITPIPKGADRDPCVPLNYRGIRLLSCVQKIYSSLLNKRLIQNLEYFDLLVDEQNGSRKKRSCVDHVYALTSAVQNRLSIGQCPFAAFIDIQKAFDWVDRDLVFYKLLSNNSSGKIYQAIKFLYAKASSCVKLTVCIQIGFARTRVLDKAM